MIQKIVFIPVAGIVGLCTLATLAMIGNGAAAVLKGLAFALMLWQ